MNPLRRLDAFHRERPFASDAIVAGLMVFFLVLVPALLLAPGGGIFGVMNTPGWLLVTDTVVATLLVSTWAFRRRNPVPALRAAVLLCLVILVIGPDFTLSLFVVPMFVHHAAASHVRSPSPLPLPCALPTHLLWSCPACCLVFHRSSKARTICSLLLLKALATCHQSYIIYDQETAQTYGLQRRPHPILRNIPTATFSNFSLSCVSL